MIDEIMNHFRNSLANCRTTDIKDNVPGVKAMQLEALTAIYEIGLEVIGKPRADKWEGLRQEQRKAWAKACGVAEK